MVRAQTVYAVGGYAIPDFASPDPIGSSTPNSGVFTTLAASGAVTGAGFTARFSAPGAIGDVTPSTGAFTTLTTTGNVGISGIATMAGITATGAMSYVPTGSVAYTYSGNSQRAITIANSNAGSSVAVGFSLGNGTSAALFGIDGTGSNWYGGTLGNGTSYIYTQNNTFAIIADGTGTIKFAVGGTTEVAEIKSTGLEVTGTVKSTAGTGTAEPVMVGTLSVNTTAVGNVGAGTDDLMTYPLPANSLSANNKGIRATVWGTVTNNANAKAATFNFGATSISLALRANQDGAWRAEFVIMRTGSGAQILSGRFQGGLVNGGVTDHLTFAATPAETDTGAITVKCTGTGVADNDIVQKGMIVEFIS